MDLSPFVAALGAVFFAEMVGDRSLYAISSLAWRYGAARVITGVTVAYAMKMAVAVIVGHKLAELPSAVVAAVSAAMFFVTAAVLFFRRPRPKHETREAAPFGRAASVSFSAIFFTEWADVGQLTAAMLAARFGAPLLVWSGATLAMMAKGAIALLLALGVRSRIRPDWLRYGACAICIVLGILAALRVD